MGWLFAQLWFWLLLAFLIGSLIAYAAIAVLLPHVNDVEAESGRTAEGVR